jgi:hypothetical protein
MKRTWKVLIVATVLDTIAYQFTPSWPAWLAIALITIATWWTLRRLGTRLSIVIYRR